jgi:hypothetical protein
MAELESFIEASSLIYEPEKVNLKYGYRVPCGVGKLTLQSNPFYLVFEDDRDMFSIYSSYCKSGTLEEQKAYKASIIEFLNWAIGNNGHGFIMLHNAYMKFKLRLESMGFTYDEDQSLYVNGPDHNYYKTVGFSYELEDGFSITINLDSVPYYPMSRLVTGSRAVKFTKRVPTESFDKWYAVNVLEEAINHFNKPLKF